MQRCWILPRAVDRAAASRLAREFSVPLFVADLLLAAGHTEDAAIERFLNPRLANLTDPNLLPGMPAVVERIDLALRRKERIVLYGDYDVDGVTSLAILHRLLNAYGAKVECFLPLREGEGYGLSQAAIDRCVESHCPELLIAVDCGTNSTAEISRLQDRGIDVIVLDHHEPDASPARCAAMVNPKLGDGAYAYLCSAGIAFKTAHALLKHSPIPNFDLKEILDLVALATLCDLVPLIGENRALVRRGLEQMSRTRWPGLAALLEVSGVSFPVRSTDIGFRLGPRINAAGRLGTAQEVLQLLLTNDPREAVRLAASLDAQNRERQAVERHVAHEVEMWIESNFDPSRHRTIVAGSRDWHQGVVGIVASRVTRRHHRPTFVVAFDESGHGKGSGRSIEGLSLVDVLRQCSDHLGNFGGHDMAAGLHVHENAFEDFRGAFEAAASAKLTSEMLTPRLMLDAEVHLNDFGQDLLLAQSMLEPFGAGNTRPLLFTRSVTPVAAPHVLKQKHLRFSLRNGRRQITAIYFNGAEHDLPRPPWDIAFHLERNDYMGRVEAQMQIVDIRSAA